MRIGIVGGVERNEGHYRQIAARAGHAIEFHGGHMGRGGAAIEELVRRSDLVVVVTDVNSHGAVGVARQAARRFGVPLELHRRFSTARLATILAQVAPTRKAG